MKNQLLLIISIPLLFFTEKQQAQCLEQDSLALVDLYNSTGGPAWFNNTNWLTEPVYLWYGIELNEDSTRVIKIDLTYNNLEGILLPSISNLTSCREIYFGSDLLSGSLPDSLGKMINLEKLFLNENKFSNEIPASIGL